MKTRLQMLLALLALTGHEWGRCAMRVTFANVCRSFGNKFFDDISMKRIAAILAYAGLVATSGYAPALAASSSCVLATSAEVSVAAGERVVNGTTTGPLNSVCEWRSASDSSVYVNIQKFGKDYWSPERLAQGYRKIDGIGEKAFAVPELGGWKACALSGKNVVCVNMNGGRASADVASVLLKTSLQRLHVSPQ